MQIKSWQIGLIAIFIQILFLIYLVYSYFSMYDPSLNNDKLNSVSSITGLMLSIELIFMSGITMLLKSSRMKKIGAITGILFGIAVFAIFRELFAQFLHDIYLYDIVQMLDYLVALSIIPSFFLLAAGVYYFWKKV